MQKALEVLNLAREYKMENGTIKKAVNSISFSVEKGEVFGILGPNGAGKTTTIKILTTLLSPTSGNVKVLGLDVNKHPEEIRKEINFVYGGEKGVYNRLTPKEYLTYFCILYQIPHNKRENLINSLIKLVGIEDAMEQKIHTFSKGMIQRLHIARALINDPKIIFLDEPTIGLDPLGAKLFREIVKNLSNKGITIILTTHYMYEAEELCDRVTFINKGNITAMGTPEEIKNQCNNFNFYEATIMGQLDISNIKSNTFLVDPSLERVRDNINIIKFSVKKEFTLEMIEQDIQKYGKLLNIQKKDITLEDAYIYLMKEVG